MVSRYVLSHGDQKKGNDLSHLFDNIFLQIACLVRPNLSGEDTQTIANHCETSRTSTRALGRKTDGLEPVQEPVNRSSSRQSAT